MFAGVAAKAGSGGITGGAGGVGGGSGGLFDPPIMSLPFLYL